MENNHKTRDIFSHMLWWVLTRVFGIPKNFKMVCLKKSKQVHAAYKNAAIPLHGCYFGATAVLEHGVLAWISGGLLLLLAVGWLIEEHIP